MAGAISVIVSVACLAVIYSSVVDAFIVKLIPFNGFKLVSSKLGGVGSMGGAIAAVYQVMDSPKDAGDMYSRHARPSDPFVKPFLNDLSARAAITARCRPICP